jgi:hypothetical protein
MNDMNLKIPHWRLNVHRHMHTIVWDGSILYCLLVLGGVGSNMHFHRCPLTGSFKPSLKYFFLFVVFGGFQSSVFIYFNITIALFVPWGGCNNYPRTFNQCCYQWRPLRRSLSTILMYYVPVLRWAVSISQPIKIWISTRIFFLHFKFCLWRCLWYAGLIFSDPQSLLYSI